MIVEIDSEQTSLVVSKELRALYDDLKSDIDEYLSEADLPQGMTQEQLQQALLFFIEYFTSPIEFDLWYRKDVQK